jgi:hypothetical protein
MSQRSVLIRNGNLTPELVNALRVIYRYSSDLRLDNPCPDVQLNRVEASRLWYRCGMKLSHLEKLLEKKLPPSNGISFEDFLDILSSVIREEEESLGSQQPYNLCSTVFQVSRGNMHFSWRFFVLLTLLFLV